jgi:hypothetical protein
MVDMTIPEGALSIVGFQHATDESFRVHAAEDRSPDNVRTFAVRCARVVQKQSKVPLAEDHHSVG